MGDTRQVVRWSLEQACPFRQGENWSHPQKTSTQLFYLELFDRAARENRILDGICVISWEMDISRGEPGVKRQIPSLGLLLDDLVGDFEDIAHVRATCEACIANASAGDETGVGGCHGALDVYPDSQMLESLLWKIVQEQHLETRLKAAFQETDPLWYSFWIDSPLKPNQMELLGEILRDVGTDETQELEGQAHFLDAMQRSLSNAIPLHVQLTPPGHVDFGLHTIFPHCPRCRASAPVQRWQASCSEEKCRCEVCGVEYDPNEHSSTTKMELEWNPINLKTHLGPEGYEDFLQRYHILKES